MPTRFMWENRVDLTATTITAGSANADLPVANVRHPHRTKVYRTGTSAAGEWILFDFGSAKTVQAAILLDHTLTGGDAGIKLQGNATNSWGSPSVDESLAYNVGTMAKFLTSEQSYRYWRIIFTKSSAGETRDIGRIFLGPFYEALKSFKYGTLKIMPIDPSDIDKSIGGQSFSDIKSAYDSVKGDFGFIGDVQNTQMRSLADMCGTHTPWFLSIDDVNKPYDLLYYGRTVKLSAFQVEMLQAGAYVWSTALEFEESL